MNHPVSFVPFEVIVDTDYGFGAGKPYPVLAMQNIVRENQIMFTMLLVPNEEGRLYWVDIEEVRYVKTY